MRPQVAADAIVFAAEHPERKRVLVGYPTVESTVGEKFIRGVLHHYLAHASWDGLAVAGAGRLEQARQILGASRQ